MFNKQPLRATVLLLTGLLLLCSSNGSAEPRTPTQKDRCPVCGMFVAPYPDWTATLLFNDGSQLFFDGPKDLFRYYFALPNQHDSRRRSEVSSIYLTDYYSTRLLPAEQLFLVLGSDVLGPMGKELVPVAGAEAAKTFALDHNGEQVISVDQLTPKLLPGE